MFVCNQQSTPKSAFDEISAPCLAGFALRHRAGKRSVGDERWVTTTLVRSKFDFRFSEVAMQHEHNDRWWDIRRTAEYLEVSVGFLRKAVRNY